MPATANHGLRHAATSLRRALLLHILQTYCNLLPMSPTKDECALSAHICACAHTKYTKQLHAGGITIKHMICTWLIVYLVAQECTILYRSHVVHGLQQRLCSTRPRPSLAILDNHLSMCCQTRLMKSCGTMAFSASCLWLASQHIKQQAHRTRTTMVREHATT